MFLAYISAPCCPINTEFGMRKQNHMLTRGTWQKWQTSEIQNGGRPPVRKSIILCISTANHPISLKVYKREFWFQQWRRQSKSKLKISKSKLADRRHIEFFFLDNISSLYCPINAKFGVELHADTCHLTKMANFENSRWRTVDILKMFFSISQLRIIWSLCNLVCRGELWFREWSHVNSDM